MPDKKRISFGAAASMTLLLIWTLIIIYPMIWTFLGFIQGTT